MATGWFVFRGDGPHTVWYMNGQGAEVGASERHFFATKDEAREAIRAFRWRYAEIAVSYVL